MARVKPVVFISSTKEDLDGYRSAARDAAVEMGFDPIMMEYFVAQGQKPPYEACKKRVDDADVLVTIVAHRYGWIPPDQPGLGGRSDKSITWLECEQAQSEGKEVLAFVVDEKCNWPFELREAYRGAKAMEEGTFTQAFGEEVNRNVGRLKEFKLWLNSLGFRAAFTSPADLKAAVLGSLHDWLERHPDLHVAPAAPRRDPSNYLRWLREQTAWIDIRGLQVGGGRAYRFPIDELYIPLTMATIDDKGRVIAGSGGPVLLEEALRHPRLVIIGNPGSGKTTFLHRIAFELCRTSKASSSQLQLPATGFPILLRIAELGEHVRKHVTAPGTPSVGSPKWLPRFLAFQSKEQQWDLDEEFFASKLNDSGTIVLVDSFDEAQNRLDREELARLFESAINTYRNASFVVTTRPGAYHGRATLAGFRAVRIDDLADSAIATFVTRWSQALYPDDLAGAERYCRELFAAVQERAEIRRMAGNPVMLTALAVLHWNERRLPEQRADLYESIVVWLARSREQREGRETADRCLALLSQLALCMQNGQKGRLIQISKGRAAELIEGRFREIPDPDRYEHALNFLEQEEVDSGIIFSRGSELRFWHLTFQEYLAARACAGLSEPAQQKLLLEGGKLYSPEWREVLLLLAQVLITRQGPEKVDGLFASVLDDVGEHAPLAVKARAVGLLEAMVEELRTFGHRPADKRYIDCLHQVLQLCDLSFIKAKCKEGQIESLLREYSAVLDASGLSFELRQRIDRFHRFVQTQKQLLVSHPELIIQQAVNEPDTSLVAKAGRAEASHRGNRLSYCRWVNKPQMESPCVRTLLGHSSYVNSCDVSPDGARIASASSDGSIKIWHAASGNEMQALRGHSGPVEGCSFDPDGLRVISGARNGEVKMWDAVTADVLWSGAHLEPVSTCRFSPNGERVVSASWDGTLKVWDAGAGVALLTIPAHQGPVYSCEFSPDGAHIASAGGDGTLKLWDAATGKEIRSVAAHDLAIMCCRFADKGAHLFTASQDMTLKRWDAATLQELNRYEGPEAFTWAAAISPKGDRLVSGSSDGSIRIWDVETGAELASTREHYNEVWDLAFFPDGSRFVSASWDRTLKVWNLAAAEEGSRAQRTPARTFRPEETRLWGYVIACCCSPDGRYYAGGASDGGIRIWETATGKLMGAFPLHDDFVYWCAFSPDSRWLVSAAMNGHLKIFDAREQRVSDEASNPSRKTITFCAFTNDGRRVIACSEDAIRIWSFDGGKLSDEVTWSAGEDEEEHFAGCAIMPGGDSIIALRNDRFEIWDISTLQSTGSIPGQSGVVVFTLHPQRQTLATVSGDGSVRLWNVTTGAPVGEVGHVGPHAVSINFSPDGDRLVLGLRDHTVSVWDVETAGAPMVLTGHTDEVQDACFTPDGGRILSTAVDGTVRLWGAQSGAALAALLWPAESAAVCVFSPNGKHVVTASHRHAIQVWSAETGELRRILSGHREAVRACAFSADGKLLSASADGTLQLWHPEQDGPLSILRGHNGPVQACEFSADGAWIVSAGQDRTVRLWDTATGVELATLEGHDDWVQRVMVIANGRRIASCSLDRTVRIWDVATKRPLHVLRGHETAIGASAAAPDGLRIVTGGEDGVLHVWDTESGAVIATLSGHLGAIRACACAGAIVSASQDGTLRLWDLDTGRLQVSLEGHEGPVQLCLFSPDGRHIVSGSQDQFVKVWNATTGRQTGEYWVGSAALSLSWRTGSRRIAVGDALGRMHLLELEGAFR
jgi:WD40 repeat protein